MPEGHTIHRLAREHRGCSAAPSCGARARRAGSTRAPRAISGQVLRTVEPYGKHLLYRFDGLPERLHVHLGLYGKFVPGRAAGARAARAPCGCG